MEEKSTSLYRKVANSIYVTEISCPIVLDVSPHQKVTVAFHKFMEVDRVENWCCLVRDENETCGYIPFFGLPNSDAVAGEVAKPITPEIIIPDTTPIIDLPILFEKSPFFFIMSRNDITHVVSYRDMDKLPMKFCIFSLIMELETAILELLLYRNTHAVEKFLGYFPKERLEKARNLCRTKREEETPERILQCSTFIDKKCILWSDEEIRVKLPFTRKSDLDTFFNRLEKIRNQVAHSGSILNILKTPNDMRGFLEGLQEFISSVAGARE